jgi:excisionase family DNA binding protein
VVDQFFTPAQAAARLAVGMTTIREEIRSGRLVALRVGRAVRISETELARWIGERLSVRPKDRRTA